MTTDPELVRAVRAFLDEGGDRLPDRVFQAVMDDVPRAPQRRRVLLPWRTDPLPSSVKILLLAATAVLIGAAAVALLPGGGRPGPSVAPSPSAVSTVAPTPIVTPPPTIPATGAIGAGTYRVGDSLPVPLAITFPAGWSVDAQKPGEVAFGGADGRYVGLFSVHEVVADPCHPGPTADPSAQPIDADQLYQAFMAMTGVTAKDLGDTVLNSTPARHLTITNSIDTSTAGCDGGLMLPLFIPVGGEPAATNGGTTQDLWILETGTVPLLVVAEGPRGTAAERAEVNGIVGSIVLE
jgi:hypothetical protein